ncbi:hypothetical protein ACFWNK_17595 [Streptomyces sp. NPDC058417]|uniref:hypothetical protein n=2 Tax=unclassified Streptomyces TaxID=2593676 RepID=UPI00364CC424
MTSTRTAAGRHRQLFVPGYAESVQPTAPPPAPDPPIYRALMRSWADGGRTLPGRQDPEWVRLAAPAVRPGQFGGTGAPLHGIPNTRDSEGR